MSKAIAKFLVSYAGVRLKVRIMPSAQDVYTEYSGAKWRMRAELPMGLFVPATCGKFTGTIIVAGNCRVEEIVPHEVVHAVLWKMGGVHTTDDEPFAYAVGILTSRILRKINKTIER